MLSLLHKLRAITTFSRYSRLFKQLSSLSKLRAITTRKQKDSWNRELSLLHKLRAFTTWHVKAIVLVEYIKVSAFQKCCCLSDLSNNCLDFLFVSPGNGRCNVFYRHNLRTVESNGNMRNLVVRKTITQHVQVGAFRLGNYPFIE